MGGSLTVDSSDLGGAFHCSSESRGEVYRLPVRRRFLEINDMYMRLGSRLWVRIGLLDETLLKKFLHCLKLLPMPSVDDENHLVRLGINFIVEFMSRHSSCEEIAFDL
jgi:hypothetical protein